MNTETAITKAIRNIDLFLPENNLPVDCQGADILYARAAFLKNLAIDAQEHGIAANARYVETTLGKNIPSHFDDTRRMSLEQEAKAILKDLKRNPEQYDIIVQYLRSFARKDEEQEHARRAQRMTQP